MLHTSDKLLPQTEFFWEIIEQTPSEIRSDARNGYKNYAEYLVTQLEDRSIEEIAFFDNALNYFMSTSATFALADAYCLFLLGEKAADLGSDGFDYFRAWLISRGREVFEKVMENTDNLADYLEAKDKEKKAFQFERMLAIASEVLENNFEENDPELHNHHLNVSELSWPDDKRGESFDLKNFPKMAAKFVV